MRRIPIVAAAALLLLAATPSADAQDDGPTGALRCSADPKLAATQRAVEGVVGRHRAGLNASDFAQIRPLFAPDAVAEWNEKATLIGVEAMAKPDEDLSKAIKFATDFQSDAVDLHGDIAIVRTHHPLGSVEPNLADGSRTPDYNREVFVLKRAGADRKISLDTFTTQPRQGEQ